MIVFWILILCAIAMAIVQDAIPGASVFHDGWYNGIDAGLVVLAFMRLRGLRRSGKSFPPGTITAFAGAAIIVSAGIVSGLTGPDTHTVAGVPGTTVPDDAAQIDLQFPALHSPAQGRSYTGAYIFRQIPRSVVAVEARDAAGNHLTMTQPTNASFLSPILLMQQRATIAGMNVAIDGFALPAVRRTVKAVLFTPQQAAQLPIAVPLGSGAVLFAISDQAGRALPRGIGVVPSGKELAVSGLRLRPDIESYPAIEVASAPYLPALIAGGVLFLGGLVRTRYRSKT